MCCRVDMSVRRTMIHVYLLIFGFVSKSHTDPYGVAIVPRRKTNARVQEAGEVPYEDRTEDEQRSLCRPGWAGDHVP